MNRNSSFFWLTDTSENAAGDDPGRDDDEEGLLQETGLSIDEDHFVEGTASSNTALQFQRHEHVLPPRPTFLPPPAFVVNEQEAQPLLAGTTSYGSQDRPLFALSENSPVERTPPILQRRMLATSANKKINDNTNPTTMPRQNSSQHLRFQVV